MEWRVGFLCFLVVLLFSSLFAALFYYLSLIKYLFVFFCFIALNWRRIWWSGERVFFR